MPQCLMCPHGFNDIKIDMVKYNKGQTLATLELLSTVHASIMI